MEAKWPEVCRQIAPSAAVFKAGARFFQSAPYSPECVEGEFCEVDVMKKAFCYASCGKNSGKEREPTT
jgi:hypothetical protein